MKYSEVEKARRINVKDMVEVGKNNTLPHVELKVPEIKKQFRFRSEKSIEKFREIKLVDIHNHFPKNLKVMSLLVKTVNMIDKL